MRKITLSALGIFAGILSIFSQEKTDSTTFKSKKLSLEEINIVSSYYHQDGNNSAITGGIGTEKLSDYANFINIKPLNKQNLIPTRPPPAISLQPPPNPHKNHNAYRDTQKCK